MKSTEPQTRRAKFFFKNLLTVLFSTLILFLALEGVFRLFGAPGAKRFVERIVIEAKLDPGKPRDEIRIFAFGESSMHGAQYGPASNPARWLEAYLTDFLPGKKVRMVNFARLGGSNDLALHAFEKTVCYRPDLAIFYLGHNAFLSGNNKEDVIAQKAQGGYRFSRWIRQSYFLGTVIRWGIGVQLRRKRPEPEDRMGSGAIENMTSPDWLVRPVRRNEPYYFENIEFFKKDLIRIVRLAKERNIPVLFFQPADNLKDFPPYGSYHSKALTPEQELIWEKAYRSGRERQRAGDWEEALGHYQRAFRLERTYADLSFRMGQAYFKRGDFPRARRFFRAARDQDPIIVRATKEIHSVIDNLTTEKVLAVVETEEALAARSPGGIPGYPLIEDNVHLSVEGHSLFGRLAAREIARRNWLAPEEEWRFDRERPYEAMARDLGIDRELLIEGRLRVASYYGTRYAGKAITARSALRLDPRNSEALRHLAWAYWMMGHKERALRIYQRLERIDSLSLDEIFREHPDVKTLFFHKKQTPDLL